MKRNISEFELSVLRSRMLEAARAKARRGELRISVPIGYAWHRELGLDFDPDLRLQEVVRLIFARFRELGSARQVFLVLRENKIHFPRPSDGRTLVSFDWTLIRYRNVISVLKNPFDAGAYVYGKSEKRTVIQDGRAHRSYGHGKPFDSWEVLIKDHHKGYVDWEELNVIRSNSRLMLMACLWQGWRCQVGARRVSVVGWHTWVRSLWAPLVDSLQGACAEADRLSM